MRKTTLVILGVGLCLVLLGVGIYFSFLGSFSKLGRYSGEASTGGVDIEVISDIEGFQVYVDDQRLVYLLEKANLWPIRGRDAFMITDGVVSTYRVSDQLERIVFRLRPLNQLSADSQNPDFSSRLSLGIASAGVTEINYTRLKPIDNGTTIELLIYISDTWTINFSRRALLGVNLTRFLLEETAVAFYGRTTAGTKSPTELVKEALGDDFDSAVEIKIN